MVEIKELDALQIFTDIGLGLSRNRMVSTVFDGEQAWCLPELGAFTDKAQILIALGGGVVKVVVSVHEEIGLKNKENQKDKNEQDLISEIQQKVFHMFKDFKSTYDWTKKIK